MSTSTTVMEMNPIQVPPPVISKDATATPTPNSRPDGQDSDHSQSQVDECQTPSGTFAAQPLLRWNESRQTIFRLVASYFTLFVMGANDAAYGPLLPHLEKHYNLSYVVVSLVFLSPFVGYVGAAILNNYLHLKFGQRGVALIHSTAHLAAYIIIASHPPYVVLVFAFILAGLGNGIADAAWNAWVGTMANSSELLGFLHAFYGVGGVMSPLVSSSMTKTGLPWYTFYYFMIGLAVVEVISITSAFWKSNGPQYRSTQKQSTAVEEEKGTGLAEALFKFPAARVSWVSAIFLLCYVGVEVALGGWIVIFMIRVRQGDEFSSGMSAVGFWLGITIGRVILGFVSPRLGVKLATTIYIACATGLQLVFWLVPQFYVSAVAVSLQGFFLGPLFPSVVLVASQLLPKRQHVVVIGFAAAFGGCGAAVLPFLTGLLAQAKGVQVLQPIILSLLVVMLGVWLMFPRLDKKKD